MTTSHLWLIALPFVAACRAQPSPPAYASREAAIASLTTSNPGWHPGTLADCTNPFLKEMIAEDSGYRPYEVHADLNRDGLPDLAIALVKADSGKIYWLPARTNGFDNPQLIGTVDWINEGGLVARDSLLIFGKLYSDVSFSWAWRAEAAKLELLPEEPATEN